MPTRDWAPQTPTHRWQLQRVVWLCGHDAAVNQDAVRSGPLLSPDELVLRQSNSVQRYSRPNSSASS